MKPSFLSPRRGAAVAHDSAFTIDRRRLAAAWTAIWLLALATGCAGSIFRPQSPEQAASDESESQTRLVGDIAAPYGTNYLKIEGPALVTGLKGTGSDPVPSPLRAELLADMQARGVVDSNRILASPSNSLVWARGYLPPGVQKGDRFDIEVRTPPQSETTSLAGGWLMEMRLKEKAVLANQVHDGHVLGLAQGPLLVDPAPHGTADQVALNRALVLGGGLALKARPLGLVLKPEDRSAFNSKQIGDAVNKRFHISAHGAKQGVATPKTDEYVELEVHPRYKYNLPRYVRVVRSVALREAPAERLARLELLERQLLDPVTSATAALRLEAIGKDAIKVLHLGLKSKDLEVRFYSAEALAYLDDAAAAKPLAEAIRREPAFRAYALAALGALDDVASSDELKALLDVPSTETRYGAFRALWSMNENDPLVRGEQLGGKFSYHVLATAGPPLIHVTRSFRPEIVIFSPGQQFTTPLSVEAGRSIIVNGRTPDRITVSRFAVGEADQKRVVTSQVDDVIRAIVELGGDYPDVVQALQQAKAAHALPCRLEVDALPQQGRRYDRAANPTADEPDDDEPEAGGIEVANPAPNLFGGKKFARQDAPPDET